MDKYTRESKTKFEIIIISFSIHYILIFLQMMEKKMISINISRQNYILLQYSNTIHSIQCCCFCSYYMAWNVHVQLGIHIMPSWYLLKEAFFQKITKNKMIKLVIFTFKNNCRCYVNYVVSSIASVKKNTMQIFKIWLQIWNQHEKIQIKNFTSRFAHDFQKLP